MTPTVLTVGGLELMPLLTSLKETGVSLMPTTSGRTGLRILQQQTPDLIVLSARLPDMSGLDVCYRVKKVTRLKQVPVLMLVPNHDHERYRAEAQMVGADKVLMLPVSNRGLQEVVGQFFESGSASGPTEA